ncbi:uncharacterized protein LOC117645067 [Thrips palmi]|uniref:Uncharacterized protein LOC117645067 n=1 Tax=Thrips palmi TaxID=161013 RepID=A0A6P8YLS9_THRPL|nr:uncharacterized protein LOC117645067 [Thrips palmi]
MAAEQLLAWSRPTDVPSPAVWGRHEHQGVQYRVQEATPDLHEKILDYYVKEYFHDEPCSKNINLPDDEVSMAEFRFLLATALTQGSSLVVLEEGAPEGEPEIVGAMVIPVLSKRDPELPEFQGRGIRVMLCLSDTLRSSSPFGDPFTRPEALEGSVSPWAGPVPHFALDLGLWVRRDRRGRSLGLAILKAIPDMCRAFGIHHFSTPFTGARSQGLAVKAGLKEISRLKYDAFLDPEGKPAFHNMPEVECVLMGIDIE